MNPSHFYHRCPLICLFLLLLVACTVTPVSQELPPERGQGELTILPALAGSVVSLRKFPDEVTVHFNIRHQGQEVDESLLDEGRWLLFEDNQPVEIIQMPVAVRKPLTIVFIYDLDAGADMGTSEAFALMLQQAQADNVAGDRWLFCSTHFVTCDDWPAYTPYDQLYDGMKQHMASTQITPLEGVLRRNAARPLQPPFDSVLVIHKYRIDATIPYLPEFLVTDLLLNQTKVILVNWTETNDTPEVKQAIEDRIRQLNGEYIPGNASWDSRLRAAVSASRPQEYTLTYRSHLFSDSKPHELLLGYVGLTWEAWDQGEFRFQPTNQGTVDFLQPWVQPSNSILFILLPLAVLLVMVLSKYDQ